MSYRTEILEAENPSAGLRVAASIIETLHERLQALEDAHVPGPDDQWETWSDKPPATLGSEVEVTGDEDWLEPGVRESTEIEIAACERELHGNEDVLESKVLRAKLFLLKDKLVRPPDNVDLEQQRTVQVASDSGDVTVNVPVPDDETTQKRTAFVEQHLRVPMTEEYGAEDTEVYLLSYLKAGPLILYYTDRDFVNRLPDDLKIAMVEDVERYSPAEAHEMSRDILKDVEAGNPEIAIENTPAGETG